MRAELKFRFPSHPPSAQSRQGHIDKHQGMRTRAKSVIVAEVGRKVAKCDEKIMFDKLVL